MQIFRICDARFPVWDGTGAALMGGRWNRPGRPVIYGSCSYACAMLEILVHANIGRLPSKHHFVSASVPQNIEIERYTENELPIGWNAENLSIARQFGDDWLTAGRTPILLVPSVIAPMDWNALVNPAHPDAKLIQVSQPAPERWDKRLWGK